VHGEKGAQTPSVFDKGGQNATVTFSLDDVRLRKSLSSMGVCVMDGRNSTSAANADIIGEQVMLVFPIASA
jgi:hypothetical protein